MGPKTIRLSGEVTGISKSGDVDDVTVGVHPEDFPVVTNTMTFQLPHEDDVADLYRKRMFMYVVFAGDDDGEAVADEEALIG